VINYQEKPKICLDQRHYQQKKVVSKNPKWGKCAKKKKGLGGRKREIKMSFLKHG